MKEPLRYLQNAKEILVKKNLVAFFIFILVGILHMPILFADRDDEANKLYLDAYNLYKLGKIDQSLEMLKKVIEITPDHAEAHFGMGSIYFRQNMFDDAVKEFTKVTRIKPEYVEAYQRLWLAYKKLGMNDKAEEELLKYKKLIEERMQTMGGGSPRWQNLSHHPHNEKNGLRRPSLQKQRLNLIGPRDTASQNNCPGGESC